MDTVIRPEWASGPIAIDEGPTVMGQYPTNFRWNGWLCPHIDPLSVEQVMAWLGEMEEDQPSPTHEWREDGALLLTEYDGLDAYTEVLEPDADGLYALGAYAWVWSEA